MIFSPYWIGKTSSSRYQNEFDSFFSLPSRDLALYVDRDDLVTSNTDSGIGNVRASKDHTDPVCARLVSAYGEFDITYRARVGLFGSL